MYRSIAIAAVVIFAGVNMVLFAMKTDMGKVPYVSIITGSGRHNISVETADDDRERTLGLMYRKDLPVGTGMLFLYEEPGEYGIWMKNMNFAIDIVFIDELKRIDGIVHSAQPCPKDGLCPIDHSKSPIKYVLEIPGGYCLNNRIKEGDRVVF